MHHYSLVLTKGSVNIAAAHSHGLLTAVSTPISHAAGMKRIPRTYSKVRSSIPTSEPHQRRTPLMKAMNANTATSVPPIFAH